MKRMFATIMTCVCVGIVPHVWALPDLIVEDIWTTPSPIVAEQQYVFYARIRNQGDAVASAGFFFNQYVYFYRNGNKIGEATHDAIQPGASVEVSITSSAPYGTHSFRVDADATGRVDESNETNNTLQRSWNVQQPPQPDLVIVDIWTTPTTPVTGQSYTINTTIRNQGVGSIPAMTAFNTVFKLNGATIEIHRKTLVTGLQQGQSVVVSRPFTAPAEGSHSIFAMADSSYEILESNEGNNSYTRGISVVAPVAVIVVASNPSNGGTASGGGTFTVASSRQISATANSGWTFTEWNDGNTQNPRTINVPASGATYTANFSVAQQSWSAGYQDLGGGWRRLAWFWDYIPMGGEGWIWHGKHGFLFVPPSAVPESIWMYSQDMGWMWTGNTTYPFLYRLNDGAWLWYNGSRTPRWFINMNTSQWERWP